MDWLSDFKGRVEENVPLSGLTWFKLGGQADYVVSPGGESQLGQLVRRAESMGIPLRVLGGGANVLIRDDGVNGVVVRLDDAAFSEVRYDGELVTAGGGADLMRLCDECVERGLGGLECLAGIPGTVGGAIRMNAGGRFGSIGERVEHVRVMRPDGAVERLEREEVGFGYRHTKLEGCIVLEATFRLQQDEVEALRTRFRENLAVKKAGQPYGERSAGCVFKNPPGDSAGRLIDEAGLKGAAEGGARVSEEHANFIVTRSGATASDVLRLVEEIRRTVRKKSGVELELEIDIW